MSSVKYDIEMLKRFNEFDVEKALEGVDDNREYFDLLTDFAENSENFLNKYSPYKISTRDEAQRWFIQELKRLRIIFTDLGLTDAVLDLNYLERAAFCKDADALETELSEFNDSMKKISELIVSARVDSETEATGSTAPSQAKRVILAVDDMLGLISTIVRMLQDEFTVIALTSAKAALKALEKQTPELFLLDIEMPVMDGYELAAEIRANPKFADTPIIFLTAKSTRDDVVTAIQTGGNDYIIKPVDKEMLLSKIHRYLP